MTFSSEDSSAHLTGGLLFLGPRSSVEVLEETLASVSVEAGRLSVDCSVVSTPMASEDETTSLHTKNSSKQRVTLSKSFLGLTVSYKHTFSGFGT